MTSAPLVLAAAHHNRVADFGFFGFLVLIAVAWAIGAVYLARSVKRLGGRWVLTAVLAFVFWPAAI